MRILGYILLLGILKAGLAADLIACNKKTDIIFVLDRSGSIRSSDYDRMRNFLDIVAKRLNIGVKNDQGDIIGQGAIVTFSEEGEERITLKQSQTPGRFARVVKTMNGPLVGGRTKTHLGLATADKVVAIKEAGLRVDDPDVKKMIMVITDGEQTEGGRGYVYVADAIKPFLNRDMDVFAVGIGLKKEKAIKQINDMVIVPENAIFAENYQELIEKVGKFIERFCPVPPICGSSKDDCHPTLATCKDIGPGAYVCTCKEGYTGDGKSCAAIRMCGTVRDRCHRFAACIDTSPGNYECTCNKGYTGDGKTCTAISICRTEKDDCHKFAACTDTGPGSYTCTCNNGYTGDGKTCTELKVCGSERDDCHRFATCTDTAPGSYKCTCNEGYSGNGKSCTAIRICGTSEQDCDEKATCVDTGPGTYQCTCNEGYTGDGKSCSAFVAPEGQCQKMDIIFVLDRSSSIRPSDYDKMRTFLEIVAKRLKIGEKNEKGEIVGQGAIVTFSENGERRLTLKESQTPGRFARVVRTMDGPLAGGRTKTHLGLATADKEVAIKAAGLRVDDPEVRKMIMVITDGEQTRGGRGYVYVGDAMKPFFERDMDVFAVGVGLKKEKAIRQINDMVQVRDNAIFAENYQELIEKVENFIKKFCPVPDVCGSEMDDCHPTLSTCGDLGEGSYECTCLDGYVGNGKFCIAPAYCGSEQDDCHPSLSRCEDTGPGTYNCTCKKGYVGDGKTCTGLYD